VITKSVNIGRSGAKIKRHGVLFVCTGNICRSPTAEGVFRAVVEREGLSEKFLIDSAGTHGYHIGEPPDPRAISHARRRGYDISGLCARRIEAADFARFDLILACDQGHRTLLLRLADKAQHGRIAMFLDYAPELGISEIPDPYYGGPAGFEHVLDICERASAGLLAALTRDVT